MNKLSILFLSISLLSGSFLIAQEEDACKAYNQETMSQRRQIKMHLCLNQKEICKSKDAIAKEKEAEKNLKRAKKW